MLMRHTVIQKLVAQTGWGAADLASSAGQLPTPVISDQRQGSRRYHFEWDDLHGGLRESVLFRSCYARMMKLPVTSLASMIDGPINKYVSRR